MKPTKPVKAFKHKDAKRAHIPSAEEAGYEAYSPKVRAADTVELPLNPVITRGQDPELFWMHKYADDKQLAAQVDELSARLKANDTAGARLHPTLRPPEPSLPRKERPEDRRPRHQPVWRRDHQGCGGQIGPSAKKTSGAKAWRAALVFDRLPVRVGGFRTGTANFVG